MGKRAKKQRNLNELFYELAPYFRSLVPDDTSDDFLPILTVMFPKKWIMLASERFRPTAQAYGDGAVEYIFKLPSADVLLDEVVELVEKAIQYNLSYDEKVRALEEEKEKLKKKLDQELESLLATKLNDVPHGVEIVDVDETIIEENSFIDNMGIEEDYHEPSFNEEQPYIYDDDPAGVDDPYMDRMMADLAKKGKRL
jgi:hypothetical protein